MIADRADVVWRVLRAEGLRAVLDRILDRLAEAKRRRSFPPLRHGRQIAGDPGSGLTWPVLTLAAAAPAMRLGGVQAQLLDRLEIEELRHPTALLYPERQAWRLELSGGSVRGALLLPREGVAAAWLERDPGLERAVDWAAAQTRARTLHVEGLAGPSFASLLRLGRDGLRLILAVHDFSLYCPRPHLLEKPDLRFCHYSRDRERCARCLRQDQATSAVDPERWRALGRELLLQAAAVVFPSDFLRRAHEQLFSPLPSARLHVIAPAAAAVAPSWRPEPARQVRHVACVGWMHSHKGTGLFEEVLRLLGSLARRGVRFSAYGGGDPDLLRRLRRLGVVVRGYYRRGRLPELLVRDRVDLAVLPSIVPESYGLVLDECRMAGVRVLAFDCGALGERIREGGGGLLVELSSGAQGVAEALRQVLAGQARVEPWAGPPAPSAGAGPTCERWLALYRELDTES
jgi:glycosyltransferase involved in cell wall biosynthesis